MTIMAGNNVIYKNLSAFKGLDLRASDILRPKDNSTDMNNTDYRETGAMNKRKGYQRNTDGTAGGYGMTTYKNVNITSGIVTEELLSIDDNLHILTDYTFNITYSGSDTASYEVYVKDATANTVYFKIIDGVTTVLDTDLGVGDEGSPVTVSDLVALINALTDFTSGTISGSGTMPAALLPIVGTPTTISTGGGTSVAFTNLAQVSTPTGHTNPFATFITKIANADFENATFAQIQDVLYIATGYDNLHKYDGTRVYRAGMPKATTPTAASAGSDAGSFTNNRIVRYKIECEYTDAKGNITVGEISEYVAQTASGTGEAINTTYTELAGSDGYDVDGTLKYNIYRTDDSADATDASLYYLVHIADHGDTIPWKDTGVAEGAEYIPPIKLPNLPPKCKYVDVWRGQLIMAGDITATDTVYYSDVTSAEHFPTASNSFIVNNSITGLNVLDNVLYAFEKNSINGITGDLGVDNFQVDPVSREGIGCVSHHSIKEVQGALFFLSDSGVYRIAPGIERPDFIGERLSPKFNKLSTYQFKQATAFNIKEADKYMLFMPTVASGASAATQATSDVYVYDYSRDAWLKWTNMNMMGGIAKINTDIYFTGRVSTTNYLQKSLTTGTTYDYADHVDAITWSDKSSWETLEEPSLWKKFLRLKVHSYDTTIDDFESQVFSIVCKQEIDWDTSKTVTIATMDFSGGSNGWGIDAWGQFPWGQSRLKQLKRKMMSKKCKSVRIIFENSNLHENILISGYEIQVVASYRNHFHE